MTAMAILLSSTSSSLLLRKNPNPKFLHSLSLKPSPLRSLPPISASLSPPPPLFFARVYLSSPLTVVTSTMAKFLDLYSGVLILRVLLTWFPNVAWHRQPFTAIREICDPYLSLFRSIIKPVFNIDITPIVAFMVLGFLRKFLNSIN